MSLRVDRKQLIRKVDRQRLVHECRRPAKTWDLVDLVPASGLGKFDRAANVPEAQAFDESGRRCREIADEIHAEVCERGFDPELNSFVQAYGTKRLDASLF